MKQDRLIVDTKDGRRDRFIDHEQAKKLYSEGQLAWDRINGCWTIDTDELRDTRLWI